MRRLLLAYLCGVLTMVALVCHVGAENVIQLGLKMQAAQASYDWQAVPKEATPVSYATRDLLVENVPVATKRRK
jgi:hypothetical protein